MFLLSLQLAWVAQHANCSLPNATTLSNGAIFHLPSDAQHLSATMFSQVSAVQFWLSQLGDCDEPDAPGRDQTVRDNIKRSREFEMDTPPPSTPRKESSSPGKKRKVDNTGTALDDPDATPRSSQSSSHAATSSIPDRHSATTTLSMRPALPPPGFAHIPQDSVSASPSGPSGASSASVSGRGARRSASPVKNISGLRRLDKPVLFASLDDGAGKTQLPQDVQRLYYDVHAITKYQHGLYPPEIRPLVEAMYDGDWHPETVYRKPHAEADGKRHQEETGGTEEHFFDYLPTRALRFAEGVDRGLETTRSRVAHAEYYKICKIKRDAGKCMALRRSEAAWNAEVHKPLLDLAMARQRVPVVCENATTAQILPSFLPGLVTGEVAGGKLVDFVLASDVNSDPALLAAIRDRLLQLATQMKTPALVSAHLCVNQTDYTPLLDSPVAVSIETKVGAGSPEEGRVQLGIWTSAWHKRMEIFRLLAREPPQLLPTLPLILTHDHEWSLYFAADRSHTIEIYGPMRIGMTDNTQNIYELLAVLERVVAWVGTHFHSWVVGRFGPAPS